MMMKRKSRRRKLRIESVLLGKKLVLKHSVRLHLSVREEKKLSVRL